MQNKMGSFWRIGTNALPCSPPLGVFGTQFWVVPFHEVPKQSHAALITLICLISDPPRWGYDNKVLTNRSAEISEHNVIAPTKSEGRCFLFVCFLAILQSSTLDNGSKNVTHLGFNSAVFTLDKTFSPPDWCQICIGYVWSLLLRFHQRSLPTLLGLFH